VEDSHARRCLEGDAPVIAASDYVRAWPQLIAEYVDAPYITLGTDGFGRSDTRQQLRRFFEVDRFAVVMAALYGLVRQGRLPKSVGQARARYGIEDEGAAWYR
jgi:pyruvate dehydrogenase E1 component